MKKKVTAVFDIGKTNKKFFLFDQDYREVYREYIRFDEIEDEDGFQTENLQALQKWIKELFNRMLQAEKFDIRAINFSTYGASFVHLDENGKAITPLYNYIKPLDKRLITSFYEKYGPKEEFSVKTGSSSLGMMSSGMQLYWLKYKKPEIFRKIKYSLHLPQYLSYIFTGIPLSEYTSIGCHTALWDYHKETYHDWVYQENIYKILPPIVSTETSININYHGKKIKVGIGVHDSSSALIPYLMGERDPFLLLSTGTWSVALNSFSEGAISKEDIENNSLNYMRIDGKRTKATRFFLGNEYKFQVKKLCEHYGKEYGYHRHIKFDKEIYLRLIQSSETNFKFDGILFEHKQLKATDLEPFKTFEEAYHKLMIELVEIQIHTMKIAISDSPIKKIYIDGGFTDNDVFIKLLTHHFQGFKFQVTKCPLGSALGAAMILTSKKLNFEILKKNYKMEKPKPIQLT